MHPKHPSASSLTLITLAAAICATLVCVTVPAEAQSPFHYGAGGKFGVSANIITPPGVIVYAPNPPVPAFLGSGGGGGGAFEILYGDYVGLELDIMQVSANGKGRFTFASPTGTLTVEQEISTTEWHFPLLLKAQLPFKYVQPFVGVGWSLVFQREASYSIDRVTVTEIRQPEPANYAMFTTALGLNVAVDKFRLPIEARFTWHPLERDPTARADYDFYTEDGGNYLTHLSVNSEWEAQLWVMVGLQYWGQFDPW